MKNLLTALAKAKQEIKNTKLQKQGQNKFSGYKYFTPDQVEQLVFEVCSNNKLFTKFDLNRNELGEYGTLQIYHTESGEVIEFSMATAIPEIKATNIAQQLGGCVTYTERYLKQTAFGITDNSLDFDSDKKSGGLPKLNNDRFNAAIKSIQDGKYTVEKLESSYDLTDEQMTVLMELKK